MKPLVLNADEVFAKFGYKVEGIVHETFDSYYVVSNTKLEAIARVFYHKFKSAQQERRLNWKWLRHPNILRLYEYFIHDSRVYFVFENCGDIQVCRYFHVNAVGFPTHLSRESYGKKWTLQCLKALQHCHEIGLYFHDFNFQDVVLDVNLNAKVWNFDKMYLGLHQRIKATTNMCYRCPEGLKTRKFSDVFRRCGRVRSLNAEKAEVWALGASLLELLTDNSIVGREYQLHDDGMTLSEAKACVRHNAYNLYTFLTTFDLTYECKSFLMDLLTYEPKDRPTIKEALAHQWLSSSQQPQREEVSSSSASQSLTDEQSQVAPKILVKSPIALDPSSLAVESVLDPAAYKDSSEDPQPSTPTRDLVSSNEKFHGTSATRTLQSNKQKSTSDNVPKEFFDRMSSGSQIECECPSPQRYFPHRPTSAHMPLESQETKIVSETEIHFSSNTTSPLWPDVDTTDVGISNDSSEDSIICTVQTTSSNETCYYLSEGGESARQPAISHYQVMPSQEESYIYAELNATTGMIEQPNQNTDLRALTDFQILFDMEYKPVAVDRAPEKTILEAREDTERSPIEEPRIIAERKESSKMQLPIVRSEPMPQVELVPESRKEPSKLMVRKWDIYLEDVTNEEPKVYNTSGGPQEDLGESCSVTELTATASIEIQVPVEDVDLKQLLEVDAVSSTEINMSKAGASMKSTTDRGVESGLNVPMNKESELPEEMKLEQATTICEVTSIPKLEYRSFCEFLPVTNDSMLQPDLGQVCLESTMDADVRLPGNAIDDGRDTSHGVESRLADFTNKEANVIEEVTVEQAVSIDEVMSASNTEMKASWEFPTLMGDNLLPPDLEEMSLENILDVDVQMPGNTLKEIGKNTSPSVESSPVVPASKGSPELPEEVTVEQTISICEVSLAPNTELHASWIFPPVTIDSLLQPNLREMCMETTVDVDFQLPDSTLEDGDFQLPDNTREFRRDVESSPVIPVSKGSEVHEALTVEQAVSICEFTLAPNTELQASWKFIPVTGDNFLQADLGETSLEAIMDVDVHLPGNILENVRDSVRGVESSPVVLANKDEGSEVPEEVPVPVEQAISICEVTSESRPELQASCEFQPVTGNKLLQPSLGETSMELDVQLHDNTHVDGRGVEIRPVVCSNKGFEASEDVTVEQAVSICEVISASNKELQASWVFQPMTDDNLLPLDLGERSLEASMDVEVKLPDSTLEDNRDTSRGVESSPAVPANKSSELPKVVTLEQAVSICEVISASDKELQASWVFLPMAADDNLLPPDLRERSLEASMDVEVQLPDSTLEDNRDTSRGVESIPAVTATKLSELPKEVKLEQAVSICEIPLAPNTELQATWEFLPTKGDNLLQRNLGEMRMETIMDVADVQMPDSTLQDNQDANRDMESSPAVPASKLSELPKEVTVEQAISICEVSVAPDTELHASWRFLPLTGDNLLPSDLPETSLEATIDVEVQLPDSTLEDIRDTSRGVKSSPQVPASKLSQLPKEVTLEQAISICEVSVAPNTELHASWEFLPTTGDNLLQRNLGEMCMETIMDVADVQMPDSTLEDSRDANRGVQSSPLVPANKLSELPKEVTVEQAISISEVSVAPNTELHASWEFLPLTGDNLLQRNLEEMCMETIMDVADIQMPDNSIKDGQDSGRIVESSPVISADIGSELPEELTVEQTLSIIGIISAPNTELQATWLFLPVTGGNVLQPDLGETCVGTTVNVAVQLLGNTHEEGRGVESSPAVLAIEHPEEEATAEQAASSYEVASASNTELHSFWASRPVTGIKVLQPDLRETSLEAIMDVDGQISGNNLKDDQDTSRGVETSPVVRASERSELPGEMTVEQVVSICEFASAPATELQASWKFQPVTGDNLLKSDLVEMCLEANLDVDAQLPGSTLKDSESVNVEAFQHGYDVSVRASSEELRDRGTESGRIATVSESQNEVVVTKTVGAILEQKSLPEFRTTTGDVDALLPDSILAERERVGVEQSTHGSSIAESIDSEVESGGSAGSGQIVQEPEPQKDAVPTDVVSAVPELIAQELSMDVEILLANICLEEKLEQKDLGVESRILAEEVPSCDVTGAAVQKLLSSGESLMERDAVVCLQDNGTETVALAELETGVVQQALHPVSGAVELSEVLKTAIPEPAAVNGRERASRKSDRGSSSQGNAHIGSVTVTSNVHVELSEESEWREPDDGLSAGEVPEVTVRSEITVHCTKGSAVTGCRCKPPAKEEPHCSSAIRKRESIAFMPSLVSIPEDSVVADFDGRTSTDEAVVITRMEGTAIFRFSLSYVTSAVFLFSIFAYEIYKRTYSV